MQAQELRNKFLEYFKKQNHTIISSASLIPDNDPTVLFTTAGMHPLVPYLMGEKHPQGKRLVSVQKCVRTGDIDEIGDTTHHTFFEMLGNWSLGDYDKNQAIDFAWEFLTKELKIKPELLAVSIWQGDQNVPEDKVAFEHWLKLGINKNRIAKLGIKDNWWGPAGNTGPCGPDTEIFYWTGDKNKIPESFDPEDKLWVEIWNNVFMEYNKTAPDKFEALAQKNIDTGMGLERTVAVLNNLDDNYQTDLFLPIINEIEKLSEKKYEDDKKAFRIIADHIRSAVFILGDPKGVSPSNKDQGYVLRRLIRRAIRFAKILGIKNNFSKILTDIIIKQYSDTYPELITNKEFIIKEIEQEEKKFTATLEKGLREFAKQKTVDGKIAFILFSTYGFPLEMTEELAQENNIQINKQEFEAEFKKHQELSRTASAGMFKGGLADDSVMSTRYHTATHLLHQALRKILGPEVAQKGSNINTERLRFDFSYPDKMTPEQIKAVEDLVNEQINKALAVSWSEMTVEEAKEKNAIGLFGHKYGEKVKVYTVGSDDNFFSREICGGPHVNNTKELGTFKITKEEASSAGVRRIKAILQ